jgi:fatty-acyl-CoA synthase
MSLKWDVGCIVRKRAEMSPDKAAIIFEDDPVTYKALNDGVNRAAHLLRKRGIRNGDRVSAVLLNCIEFLEVYFACAKLGAILVPLNFRLVGRELEYQLNDSCARMVVFHHAFVQNIDEIRSRLKVEADKFIFVRGGNPSLGGSEGPGCPLWAADYHELRNDQPTGEPIPERPVEFDDPLAIVYTSGVTGNPKGAVLTHKQTYFKNFQVAFYIDASSAGGKGPLPACSRNWERGAFKCGRAWGRPRTRC